MNAETYLDVVARPNVLELVADPENFRHAVNAFLSIDALTAYIAFDERGGFVSNSQDKKVRAELAAASPAFKLLRDTAFSLKHGWLDSQARLMKDARYLTGAHTKIYCDTIIHDNTVLSNNIIMIQSPEIAPLVIRADQVAHFALEACEFRIRDRSLYYKSLEEIAEQN